MAIMRQCQRIRSIRRMPRPHRLFPGHLSTQSFQNNIDSQIPKDSRDWKSIEEVWDNASVIEKGWKPSGFGSLDEMLEYGQLKKELYEKSIRENLPPPERVSDEFTLAKHEVRQAIEQADNEVLLVPNTNKAIQEIRGDRYPLELDDPEGKEEVDTDSMQSKSRASKLAEKLEYLLPVEVEIETRVYNKIIPGGRKLSYSYFFVAGNGKGYAGWGYGKAPEPTSVKDRANVNLLKNLMYVPLYQGRTVYDKELRAKFQGTRMIMWRRREYHGVTAAPIVDLVLKCFGITDVTVKIIGPRTRTSVIKCLFKILAKVTCHTTNYRSRGKYVYNSAPEGDRNVTYKMMKEQQIRVKKVIAEIPRKYGIPMIKMFGRKDALIPAVPEEEIVHLDRMEAKFLEDAKKEQEQYIARMRKMGFEVDEEYEMAKLEATFGTGAMEEEDDDGEETYYDPDLENPEGMEEGIEEFEEPSEPFSDFDPDDHRRHK